MQANEQSIPELGSVEEGFSDYLARSKRANLVTFLVASGITCLLLFIIAPHLDLQSESELIDRYLKAFCLQEGRPVEEIGAALLRTIVGITLVVVPFAWLLWLRLPRRPSRLGGGISAQLSEERRERLDLKFEQTRDIASVRAENEALSASLETQVLYAIFPLQLAEWILPVIGFIGTVIGISDAITGLSGGIKQLFESTGGQDASSLLQEGFDGLAVAFDTTLFGLVGLVISGVCVYLLRQQALAGVITIDNMARDHIAALEIPERRWERMLNDIADHWDTVKTAIADLSSWATEKGLPGFEGLFGLTQSQSEWLETKWPDYQGFITTNLPEFFVRLLDELIRSIRQNSREASQILVQILFRILSVLNATDHEMVFTRLSLGKLIAQILREMKLGTGPETNDDLKRLIMHLTDEPITPPGEPRQLRLEGSGDITALSLSAPPYKLAYARSNHETDETSVFINYLNVPIDNATRTFSSDEERDELERQTDARVVHLTFDPSGAYLASIFEDGYVRIYDIEQAESMSHVLSAAPIRRTGRWFGELVGDASRPVLIVPTQTPDGTQLYLLNVDAEERRISERQIWAQNQFRCSACSFVPALHRIALVGQTEGKHCLFLLSMNGNSENVGVCEQHKITMKAQEELTTLHLAGSHLLTSTVTGDISVYQVDHDVGKIRRIKGITEVSGPAVLVVMDRSERYFAFVEQSQEELRVVRTRDWGVAYSYRTGIPIDIGTHSDCGRHLVFGDSRASALFVWSFPLFLESEIVSPLLGG